MPPTLRSANSSPAGKSAIPDASPARKAPTCSKCGQPRLGHPRTGCPSMDSPIKDPNTRPTKAPLQDNITRAFSSMFLDDSPTKDRYRSGAPPLQPSETLASITSSAEGLLNDLTQPGFFSQETVQKDNRGSSKDAARTPRQVRIKSGPKRLMPGTLMEPSWESSIEEFLDDERSGESPKKEPSPLKNSLGVQTSFASLDLDSGPSSLSFFSPSSATSSPTPIQRSQTLENRELFFSELAKSSPTTVYSRKRDELDSVYASAKAAKLHVRVVDGNDTDGEDVLIVIGSDLQAVEKRSKEEHDKLIKSRTECTTNTTNNFFITKTADDRSGSSSTVRAVAGGVLVGIAGAWAGLAFS